MADKIVRDAPLIERWEKCYICLKNKAEVIDEFGGHACFSCVENVRHLRLKNSLRFGYCLRGDFTR